MAIPNMQPGRIEADPMGIPIAASMKADNGGSFERLLRDSVAQETNQSERAVKPREQEEVPASEVPPPESSKPEARDREQIDPSNDPDVDADEQHSSESSLADTGADVTESISRGEPERQANTAGKGTDSPRISQPTSEPLIAASLQQQATSQPNGLVNSVAAQSQAAAARPVDPTIRGGLSGTQQNASAPKAAQVQAGYSTKNAQQAQMLEQARDSVFKQILMKLNGEGGEVRMRLEPPDLGQLDLRMTVEGGNKLSLQMSAERQDINQLLQRHLDELKVTLQESGLEVTDAEVQTRSEFDQQNEANGEPSASSNSGESASDEVDAPRPPRGFITAEGLDFWA